MNMGTKVVGIGVIMLGVALAQTPAGGSEKAKPADSSQAASNPKGSKATVPEAKTRTYKGTLVAASCAGGSGETQTASSKAAKQPAGEASRAAEGNAGQSCGLSGSVSEFALRTTDGRTLPFDLVGNERAQEAIKSNKKWESAASSGKPIQTKVHGTEDGGKLTVVSVP